MAERLYIRLEAPFAACRPFVAGWYRPTASFLTHSAVYGLLLNVAGIESRLWEHDKEHPGGAPATLVRAGLPSMRIALGLPQGTEPPRVASIFQQLHNYPVGTSGMPPELSRGTKNNITPVRREMLCDVRAVVAVDCDTHFLSRLRGGFVGELTGQRYGLPFLGDNAFILDRLEETSAMGAYWYERVNPDARPKEGTTRLTSYIDRASMSNTVSALFAPSSEFLEEPTERAWVAVGG